MTNQYSKKQILLTLLFAILLLPILAYAQEVVQQDTDNIYDTIRNPEAPAVGQGGFSNDGLYGCKGGFQNSVGMEFAGGIFVPVSEKAVAHNTNVLVYKECVLDGIVARIRETMVAFVIKSTLNWVNKGNNGEPAFVINIKDDRQRTADNAQREFIEGDRTEVIFDDFRQDIRQSLARGYAQATRKPENAYAHTIPDDKKEEFIAFTSGNGKFEWDMFLLSIQPQNNPLGAYSLALNQMLADIDEKVGDEARKLDWGNGYKSHENCKQIPAGNGTFEENCEIATPGITIQNIVNYQSLAGQRQLESADEIDELMGSLMSNIQTQILTSVGGLRGITEGNGGASYVDQIASDAAGRTRTEYTDAGTGFLAKAIATETAYGLARKQSQDTLEDTAKRIEAKEEACWDGLLARAQADLLAEVEQLACDARQAGDFGGGDDDECTIQGIVTVENLNDTITYTDIEQAQQDGTGRKEYDIKITARAADKVIERIMHRHANTSFELIARQVSPILRVVNQAVADSVKALTILTNLQASLLASNTPGNTRFVLQQVDQLVVAGSLHTEGDIFTARAQHDDTVDTMEDLYDDTVEAWDAGWCNPENWRDQLK